MKTVMENHRTSLPLVLLLARHGIPKWKIWFIPEQYWKDYSISGQSQQGAGWCANNYQKLSFKTATAFQIFSLR